MGVISAALEYFVDTWAVFMTAVVFFYHYIFNRNRAPLVAACFSVAAIYCVGHFALDWINSLPSDIVNIYRYSIRFILYICGLGLLFYISAITGTDRTTYIVAMVLGICAALQLVLHIDRNIIGLNHLWHYYDHGEVIINANFDSGYWALWDIYTVLLNSSSIFLVGYLLIGDSAWRRLWSR